jgi:hypothetical protein
VLILNTDYNKTRNKTFLLLGDDKEGGTGKGFVITFADEAPAKSKPQVITVKGSDQRENRGVWSNITTRYLVWRCGDGYSFAL